MIRLAAIRLAFLMLAGTIAGPAFSQTPPNNALTNPAALTEQAPAAYKVKFDTSKGPFVIEVHRDWAPLGADRFYNLVKNGFFNNARFFRVISGFMVQFGINADPRLSAVWRDANINDDPVKQSNTRGMITFATRGPNTRTTQVFINYADNNRLDMGFAPFGSGGVRHERRRYALWRLRRGRATRRRTRAGPPPKRGERLSDQRVSQARFHQVRNDRTVIYRRLSCSDQAKEKGIWPLNCPPASIRKTH